ncbi:protein tweety homolog 2-like [Dysidea avara]|uniref:protein tweety homolog 2-like n=1 Tax=Dysidea avara TaxID=196820 RepID=UPI003326F4A1
MDCSSDYEPSSVVEAFHDIPHFDIDLNELNSTYKSSVGDYYEAIIIWSCLPVLVGIALTLLMFVVWGVSWCYGRWKKKEQPTTYREPSRCLKGMLVTSLLACAVAGVIVCGGCFYAEVELNKDVVEVEDTVSLAESTVDNIETQATSYNHRSVQLRQLSVKTQLLGTTNFDDNIAILDRLNDTTRNLPGLYSAVLELTEGYNIDGSADDVDKFETPRHWTVIAILILLVLLFVLLFVVVLLRKPILITLTAVAVFIFMVLMWLAAGAGLGAVIITADICHDPDGTVLSNTGNDGNSEITEYFLFCNSSCGDDNPLIEAVDRLVNVHNVAEEIFNELNMSIGPSRRDGLQQSLTDLEEVLDDGHVSANALTLLAECTALNNQYEDSRDDFCDMGFIYILTLFCAATFMALLLLCILCVSKKYVNVLYAADRWDNTGFSYNFSPTPDIQSNGYNNGGNNDTARQTSVRRKQQYDGWVAGKTHQGNYRHHGEGSTSAEPEYELQDGGNPPLYADVLNH